MAAGQARRGGAQGCQGEKHPKACKLLLSAFFFFFKLLLLGREKKKQRFLWRRMQKGCRILTISCTGLPQRPAGPGPVAHGRHWPEASPWDLLQSQAHPLPRPEAGPLQGREDRGRGAQACTELPRGGPPGVVTVTSGVTFGRVDRLVFWC